MAKIVLENLAHAYGDNPQQESDYALKRINYVWNDGEACALLGPSGCGKTTLLNIISGLLEPSEGRVYFDDTDVTHVPTKDKNIAQVFQFPVVYDTMTVAENLAFPLVNRGFNQAKIKPRVEEILDLLSLRHRFEFLVNNYVYSRLETSGNPQFGQHITKSRFDFFLFYLISGLAL